MKNKISVVGGDLRIVKLAKMISQKNDIVVYGLEEAKELHDTKEITFASNLPEAIQKADTIIGAIPFSTDGETIMAPFGNKKIILEEFIKLASNKKLIAGNISEEVMTLAQQNNIEVVDLMKNEELTVLNTIATAEGAIQVAMEKTQNTIQGCKVLVLGFGRVGKTVANKFTALLAKVTCSARKDESSAWSEVYGYDYINIECIDLYLKDFDIIGADVVELAPDYDASGVSTAVATKVIRELLMIM